MIVCKNGHKHRLSAYANAMASAPSTPSQVIPMTEAFGDSPPAVAPATGESSSAIIRISTLPMNRGRAIPANTDDELARAIADTPGSSSLMVQQVTRATIQPHPAKRRAVLPSGDYDDMTEQARQLEALREMLQATYAERCQAVQQKEWLLSNEFQQRCAEAENIIKETRAKGAEEMRAQALKFHSLLQAFKEHKDFEQTSMRAEINKLQEQYKTEMQTVKETAGQRHREALGAEQQQKEEMIRD